MVRLWDNIDTDKECHYKFKAIFDGYENRDEYNNTILSKKFYIGINTKKMTNSYAKLICPFFNHETLTIDIDHFYKCLRGKCEYTQTHWSNGMSLITYRFNDHETINSKTDPECLFHSKLQEFRIDSWKKIDWPRCSFCFFNVYTRDVIEE